MKNPEPVIKPGELEKENYNLGWLIKHTFDVLLLKYKRVSVGEYWMATIFITMFLVIIQTILLIIFNIETDYNIVTISIAVLQFVWVGIISFYRLRDLGKSGWQVIRLIVPLVNIYRGLKIAFEKGKKGENTFGPNPLDRQPKKNGMYWLLFFLTTILATVLSMLAGILILLIRGS